MSALVTLRNLEKSFNSRKVLNGIDLDIHSGEIMVIMGGSGCGKSTLLRTMIGLEHADHGEVRVLGTDFSKAGEDEKDAVRKQFGMLFQGAALFNSMTVGENIALPLSEHTSMDEEIIRIIVKVKLELVGLTGFENHMPYEISGGMKKRVALARAIALDPKIVFFDEPGAGLDPITQTVIDSLILDLTRKLKMTSVVVTHEMKSAFRIADRIAVIQNGRVVALGTPAEIRNSSIPYIRQFIEGEIDSPKDSSDNSNDTSSNYLKGLFDE